MIKDKSIVDLINQLIETSDELLKVATVLVKIQNGEESNIREKSILEKILDKLEEKSRYNYEGVFISPNTSKITTTTDIPNTSSKWIIPNNSSAIGHTLISSGTAGEVDYFSWNNERNLVLS